MRWAGHVIRMMEMRVVYRVLVGKQEGKSPLGRPLPCKRGYYGELLIISANGIWDLT